MSDSQHALARADRSLTTMEELFGLFGEMPPTYQAVDPAEVSEPARSLLDHERHMTVTLERFHDSPMELSVLDEIRAEPFYARRILLSTGTGMVAQFGIMRIDLRRVSEEVRQLILAGSTPLGRLLIEHGVLRRISTHGLLALRPTRSILDAIGSTDDGATPLYGRLATIVCNESPAVDLLEVVTGLGDD